VATVAVLLQLLWLRSCITKLWASDSVASEVHQLGGELELHLMCNMAGQALQDDDDDDEASQDLHCMLFLSCL
jgi:hypothetical protein